MYYYCPIGTVTPTACPDGTITLGTGSLQLSDCLPCPRGKYCAFRTYFDETGFNPSNIASAATMLSNYGSCAAGYVCVVGAKSSTPTDGVTGYKCPVGYYCPSSPTLFQIPCPAGTYNAQVGQTSCLPCPPGSICNELAMETPLPCIAGHYCAGGNIRGVPCPPGTYSSTTSASSIATCLACPAGSFCDVWGLTKPAGLCNPGFVCVLGATTPTPFQVIYTAGMSGMGGQCPAGYYCSKGALAPVVCPIGTYNPNPGQASCMPCPKGQYCATTGLLSPTGLCDEKYFCSEGSSSPTQTTCNPVRDGYCPQGTVIYSQCPDGWNLTSAGTCQACKDGYTCTNGIVAPCKMGKYCKTANNLPYGELCPNGTYSTVPGLKNASACLPCTTQQFCLAGRIMGMCYAGYICEFGANSPTPFNQSGAFGCPLGFYCPPGASKPSICPTGMFTFAPGAIQQDQCDYCQAGFYCQFGAISPVTCPQGNYCPLGSQDPTNCSVTYYNPNTGGADYTACQPCKGGFYCFDEALGNLFSSDDTYKCPPGYYCPPGTWVPLPCKGGTYADTSLTYPPSSMKTCLPCPKNFYCPQSTPYQFQNTCPNGTYCGPKASWPTLCPPGNYCYRKLNSSSVVCTFGGTLNSNGLYCVCPAGFYCPLGTSVPRPCNKTKGEICVAGSSFPSRAQASSSICSPGQFYAFGQCNLCVAGFVCKNKTNQKYPVYLQTEGGYECPPGYYCPAGSSKEIPCPAGTFRSSIRGASLSDCQPCNSDAYSGQPAQTTCIMCGRGSTGNPSSNYSSCICEGQYRQWRPSDNQCVCQKGYDEPTLPTVAGQTSTQSQDCVPVVESTCSTGTHFDSTAASCVSDSVCEAPDLCNGQGGGYYSASALQCLCPETSSNISTYCDAACQNKSLKAYQVSSGQICLQAGSLAPECYNSSVFGQSLYLANFKCRKAKCLISTVINTQGLMQGSYEASNLFVQVWQSTHPTYRSPYQASMNTSARYLQATNQLITSTIHCNVPSDPVSFQVSQEHYPVYQTNSQYNTNPYFDAGPFDELATKLTQSNMNITNFLYTFDSEGVYVFGDSQNPKASLTIIKISQDMCSSDKVRNGNIFPLTEKNLDDLDIIAQPLELTSLPDSLIALPVVLVLLTFGSTFFQMEWEKRIEMKENELRMMRAGRKKNFENADGRLNRKQYLGDLYKLIKDNMDEVTNIINNHGKKESILKLLKDKTSLMNELGEGGKQTVTELKTSLRELLEHLRFPDGSTLKELLAAKELQKKLQQALNRNESQQAQDEELDLDELDRHTESGVSEDFEDDSDILTEAMSRGLADMEAPQSDDEQDKSKDVHQREVELERQLKIKRAQDRRKNDFKDKICDLVDDEESRDKLIDNFDEKMRGLDNLLKNENKRQDDTLAAKMAERRNRKKQAVTQAQEATVDKENEIERLEQEKRILQDDMEEILENGMKDPNLQQILDREKEVELEKIERQILVKQDLVRQEYLNRLKGAKNDKEKERILDEMQRRLAAVEDELHKEKSEQERNLERALLLRQQKRVKKLAQEREKEILKRDDEIKALKSEISKERTNVYIECGGDVADVLDASVRERVTKLVDKSVLAKEAKLELEKSEAEQLEILKAQQKLEREQAISAVEKNIEEAIERDKREMEEALKLKQQRQRDQLNQKIAGAKSEKDRKKLIAESKLMEQRLEDQMNDERLRQERLLEEKKANRRNLKKVKEIELEQKQMAELAQKETDLLQKKYDSLMSTHANKFEKDMNSQLLALEKKGASDQAILLINQASNEMIEKKLRLLISKQFFEVEKYLGTLYNQTALQTMAAKEETRLRYKQSEEEAYATLSGDALMPRITQLKEMEKTEIECIEHKLKNREKEEACAIRERLATKHFEEKQALQAEEQRQRELLVKGVLERSDDNTDLKAMAEKLIQINRDRERTDLDKLDREKSEDLERIKLQIVAENEAQVQQMQKSIEEQMAQEREMVENKIKQRRDEVLGEKRKALENRIQDMKGSLSEFQKDQIMKQYLIELNNLEKAIAMERDSQLQKMRARLIKKKIEKDRMRKAELDEQRITRLKRQIGAAMLHNIRNAKYRALEAKPVVQESAKKEIGLVIKQKINASVAQAQHEMLAAGRESLRMLLEQWREKVRGQQTDEQHIWEKQTVDLNKMDSPRSSVSKMSKITGLKGIQQPQQPQINYTMEELLKRVRRIERLTDRMSQGHFDQPQRQRTKDLAQKVIGSVMDTSSISGLGSKRHNTFTK